MKRWLWLLMIGTCSMMTAQQNNPFFGTKDGGEAADGSVSSDNGAGGPSNPGGHEGEEPDPLPSATINMYLPILFITSAVLVIYTARRERLMGERSRS